MTGTPAEPAALVVFEPAALLVFEPTRLVVFEPAALGVFEPARSAVTGAAAAGAAWKTAAASTAIAVLTVTLMTAFMTDAPRRFPFTLGQIVATAVHLSPSLAETQEISTEQPQKTDFSVRTARPLE